MANSTPKKYSVLSVLGVPKTLKPFKYKAFRQGTPKHKDAGARCSEHWGCSFCKPRPEHAPAPLFRLIAYTAKRLYLAAGYALVVRPYACSVFWRGRMAHQRG